MPGEELLRTPLFAWHQSHGARLVEFGGWSMPVQYGSIIDEHKAVRRAVGLFDISHMGRLTFSGPGTVDWLQRATTNDVARLAVNQIQYSLMASETGGVIDDILVYRQPFTHFVVCNASNRERVLAQFERLRSGAESQLADRTLDTAMIAVQGPAALEVLQPLFDQPLGSLGYYRLAMGRLLGAVDAVVSRTGYTGEDGFELIVGATHAEGLWDALLEAGSARGIRPCGLGARDTLRFEAAMPLYGHELSESINPYEAGVGWAVKLGKGDFCGRDALRTLKAQTNRARVGLRVEGKRIAREGSVVMRGDRAVGTVTSGTFSPTLDQSLAMALVANEVAAVGTPLTINVRGHDAAAVVVPLPFYHRPASD
ncbi:MAG: glycine cleavage system aminomethyltransferase GcvT [Isosphaeraceae bacterium]|nr:glycine cleavage system aminomethyltransferase GcvT [Isosphaeraceae bacterium]